MTGPTRPRRRALLLVASLPAAPLLAACGVSLRRAGDTTGAAAAGNGADRDAPRIDPPAALEAVRAGRAVLVDVRSEQSFRSRRAAGAVLLALEDIERSPAAAARTLPAGKQPILYCT